MKKYGGIIRLISVLFLSSIFIIYSAYSFLFLEVDNSFSDLMLPASADVQQLYNDEQDNKNNDEQQKTEATEKENDNSKENNSSVEASTTEKAKGKIIEKHISPYSSKLSYNNVYVKNSTDLKIDIKSLLNSSLSFKINNSNKPQVLIMHTHTTESFMTEKRDYYTDSDQSRRLNEKQNMVNLGNIVTEKLNKAGIKTLHDKTTHDYPSYSGSYSRAANTINTYLKKYPTIKIVIDMHRDAISSGTDKTKLTATINGKKAAQVMLVMGSQSGGVTNFPNWKENLKLALRFQQMLEVMYPSLARPLSLTSNNYNESLTKGSMLLEMGTDANTIEEVEYSAELVGNALVSMLNTIK